MNLIQLTSQSIWCCRVNVKNGSWNFSHTLLFLLPFTPWSKLDNLHHKTPQHTGAWDSVCVYVCACLHTKLSWAYVRHALYKRACVWVKASTYVRPLAQWPLVSLPWVHAHAHMLMSMQRLTCSSPWMHTLVRAHTLSLSAIEAKSTVGPPMVLQGSDFKAVVSVWAPDN